MDQTEFDRFRDFFEFLHGKRKFNYEEYLIAYNKFIEAAAPSGTIGKPIETPHKWLQFLYEQNVICYREKAEKETFTRWCFRERSPAVLRPRVKTDTNYEIHRGIANALNIGQNLTLPDSTRYFENKLTGAIDKVVPERRFGYLRAAGFTTPIHFRFAECRNPKEITVGQKVTFKIGQDPRGKMTALEVFSIPPQNMK